MRVVNLAILLGASLTFLVGCSTPGSKRIKLCLTDPIRDQLICDGEIIHWKNASDFVCYRLDDHEEYFRGCR